MTQAELVSVIIPAYNAEATLRATLASVRSQTHANLEIVVVDDGSTDGTRALAEAEARQDPRIRVLSVPNGGVAEARNAGIRASRGDFLAPVDADDLWHPEKIARQMAVMAEGGPGTGFVYTGYRRIDEQGRAFYTPSPSLLFSGYVFLRLILLNFVGNGSSLLMRREAFEAVGGYDPELRRKGVQGCEDYLIQILIARSWTVGVVPAYLTGYRVTPGAMSASRERMERSMFLMLEQVRARIPETPEDVLAISESAIRSRRAVFQLLGARHPREAGRQFGRSLRCSPRVALRMGRWALHGHLQGIARRRLLPAPKPVAAPPFLELDPAVPPSREVGHPLFPWLLALKAREEAFFRSRAPVSGGRLPPLRMADNPNSFMRSMVPVPLGNPVQG